MTADGQLQPDDTIDHEHSKTVRSVAFSANGKLLALASFDSKISVWQVLKDTFEYVTTLEGHESEVSFDLILGQMC
jgi:WD40 repeat protein